jgi:hypothetical protein
MGFEPVRLAGAALYESRHVCAFFRTPDEMYEVLMPFILDGFAAGERAFHIVDPDLRGQHVERIATAGVDVAEAEQRGQLVVRRWEEAYLRDGHFEQDRMLALIEEVLREAPREGFPCNRIVANMEWALQDRPGVNDLVEYEARLNYLLPRYRDPVI